jgi:hypothetical protein
MLQCHVDAVFAAAAVIAFGQESSDVSTLPATSVSR